MLVKVHILTLMETNGDRLGELIVSKWPSWCLTARLARYAWFLHTITTSHISGKWMLTVGVADDRKRLDEVVDVVVVHERKGKVSTRQNHLVHPHSTSLFRFYSMKLRIVAM